jgi:hypothetical protein
MPARPDGDGSEPFSMTPRQATDARANFAQNRERDAQRGANASDSVATVEGRNPKGEGRRTA